MESPSNRGDKVPTKHFLSLNETSSTKNELYCIEFFSKRNPTKPSNKPDYCQGYCLFSTKSW